MNQSKIKELQQLFHLINFDVKKDIKTELIKFDYRVFQKLFGKTYITKLTIKELADPVYEEICLGNTALEEWLIAKWVHRNTEIYQFFAQHLSAINPKFEEIKEIVEPKGAMLAKEAIQHFGAAKTYLFSVLNSVAFTPSLMEKLAGLAHDG